MGFVLGAFAMTDSEPQKRRGLIERGIFAQSFLNGQRAIRHHAILIGKLTFLWNAVHAELLASFIEIAGERDIKGTIDPTLPSRIWHDTGSDSGQRSLLLVFAELRLASKPELLELTRWMIAELNALATYRNDALHSAFEVHVSRHKKDMASIPSARSVQANRLARLNNVGHRRLFRAVIHDLFRLGSVNWEIYIRLSHPHARYDPHSLPEKPILRARALVEGSPPKSNGRPKSLAPR